MSLRVPTKPDVADDARLLDVLRGLYDAIKANKVSTTNLTTRVINVTGAAADGPFWVSTATPGYPNAVDMGFLGNGVLQQTVTAGVSVPEARSLNTGQVVYGAPDGLIDQVAQFYFHEATMRLGIGTNAPQVTLELLRAVDEGNLLAITNSSNGTHATAGMILQAANSDVVGTVPYFAIAQFGYQFIANPIDNTPYFAISDAALSYQGPGNVVFDGRFFTGKGWLWTTRTGTMGEQVIKAALDNDGFFALPSTLGTGGIVWADPGTTIPGTLSLVTIGTGLTFDPVTGTLDATGGGGTVTAVTASPPIFSSGGATPNITLSTDATFGVLGGQLTMIPFTGSGAGHLKGAVPDPGAVAGTANFLCENGAWAVPPGTGVPTTRTLAATSPIRIDGGAGPLDLSANRTFSHTTSGVGAAAYAWANVTVDSFGHVTAASANTAPQPVITWPAATRILVSSGTTTDPVGYGTFTYVTADNHMRNDGPITINSSVNTISSGHLWTAQSTATRDRAWWGLGGVTVADGVNREWFTISPGSTSVTTSALALLVALSVRGQDYTLGVAAGTIASVYAGQPTFNGGTISDPSTSCWVYYAGGGTTSQSNFEGRVKADSVSVTSAFTVNAGAHVIDTSGIKFFNAGAAVGVAQQTVTGSRGGNAALTSLLAALSAYGIVLDSTTP